MRSRQHELQNLHVSHALRTILFARSAHVPTFRPLLVQIHSSPLHDPAKETAGEKNKQSNVMSNALSIVAYIESLKYTQAWQGKVRQVYL